MRNGRLVSLVLVLVALCFLVFGLVGCATVKTRQVIKDRVDQDLTWGNRGYISGNIPPQEPKERKMTRKTYEIEIELTNPFKFEKAPAEEGQATDASVSLAEVLVSPVSGEAGGVPEYEPTFEAYTVQKGDTLQKISEKFYGTTRKWQKVYEANRDVLKSPDRVYPGQELSVPIE